MENKQCLRCYSEIRGGAAGRGFRLEQYVQKMTEVRSSQFIVWPGDEEVCAEHLPIAVEAAQHILLTAGGSVEDVRITEL